MSKGRRNQHALLQTRDVAILLTIVFVDLMGPLQNDIKSYDENNRYLLTIIDDCSRFLRAVAIPNINQGTV